MTESQRAFWMLAQARVSGLTPDIAAALLKVLATIRDSFSEADLAKVLTAGGIEAVIAVALSAQVLDRAFLPLRTRLRSTVERGFRFAVPQLPKAGKIDGVLSVAFDHLSEDVRTAIQRLETVAMTKLKDDIRETVRQAIARGLEDGVAPKTIARELRSVIGLGPSQLKEVENFRDMLSGDPARSLTDYTLRDPRLDRMLAKGPLSPEQIDRYTEIYRKRRIALNAATNARTITMDSYRAGQDLSWRSAIENGVVPPGAQLMKTWVQIQRPTMREEHAEIAGETVPFDEPYSNGSMIPGDQGEYNCGCVSKVSIARVALAA